LIDANVFGNFTKKQRTERKWFLVVQVGVWFGCLYTLLNRDEMQEEQAEKQGGQTKKQPR
jgi:hypothetical protein